MNIEELINHIKKRPGMFVGCIELEPVVHFINGFMLNNSLLDRVDAVEQEFKEEFHEWVRMKLEKQYKIVFEEHHNYLFYITQVNQNSEEGLRMLFELCDEFFKEVHEKEDVKKSLDL